MGTWVAEEDRKESWGSEGVQACIFRLFPTFGVGLLDFELNSSPRPELFPVNSLVVPGAPNPRVSLECPNRRVLQARTRKRI